MQSKSKMHQILQVSRACSTQPFQQQPEDAPDIRGQAFIIQARKHAIRKHTPTHRQLNTQSPNASALNASSPIRLKQQSSVDATFVRCFPTGIPTGSTNRVRQSVEESHGTAVHGECLHNFLLEIPCTIFEYPLKINLKSKRKRCSDP